MVKGGYDALVDELARTDADFVMLSEVRNYNGTRFCDRITASLKEKGKTYYSFYSYDSGLLSKYPIIDSATVFPENEDHGSIYKLVADMDGREVAVYTAHLDYRNCAYYDVRGYDGDNWAKMEAPLTDIDSILRKNVASQRDDAIRQFLDDAAKEREKGRQDPESHKVQHRQGDKKIGRAFFFPFDGVSILLFLHFGTSRQRYICLRHNKSPFPFKN